MENEVDFTTWRKGKKTRGIAKIAVCPKCGRKGEYSPSFLTPKGRQFPARYIHKGQVTNVAGMGFFEISDSCSVVEAQS